MGSDDPKRIEIDSFTDEAFDALLGAAAERKSKAVTEAEEIFETEVLEAASESASVHAELEPLLETSKADENSPPLPNAEVHGDTEQALEADDLFLEAESVAPSTGPSTVVERAPPPPASRVRNAGPTVQGGFGVLSKTERGSKLRTPAKGMAFALPEGSDDGNTKSAPETGEAGLAVVFDEAGRPVAFTKPNHHQVVMSKQPNSDASSRVSFRSAVAPATREPTVERVSAQTVERVSALPEADNAPSTPPRPAQASSNLSNNGFAEAQKDASLAASSDSYESIFEWEDEATPLDDEQSSEYESLLGPWDEATPLNDEQSSEYESIFGSENEVTPLNEEQSPEHESVLDPKPQKPVQAREAQAALKLQQSATSKSRVQVATKISTARPELTRPAITHTQVERERDDRSVAKPVEKPSATRAVLELRKSLNEKDREMIELRSALTSKSKEVVKLEESMLGAQREQISITEEVSRLEKALSGVERERDTAVADQQRVGKAAEAFRRQSDRLLGELQTARKKIEEVTLAQAAQSAAFNRERTELLERAKAELEVQKRTVVERDAALAHAEQRTKRVESRAAALEERMERIVSAAENSGKLLQSQLERANGVQTRLQGGLEEALEAVDRLRAQFETSTRDMTRNAETNAGRLETQLEEALGTQARLQTGIDDTVKTLSQMREQFEVATQAAVQSTESKAERLGAQLEEASGVQAELQSKLEEAGGALSQMNSKFDAATHVIATLQTQLNKATEAIAQHQARDESRLDAVQKARKLLDTVHASLEGGGSKQEH